MNHISIRKKGKNLVVTVALVTERVDRYNTIIEPEGCNTDFRNVVIDYNHNHVNTGAKLTNKRTEKITLDDGQEVRALVGDIVVTPQNEVHDEDGKAQGKLFDWIQSGRMFSVSIDFSPIEVFTKVQDNFNRFVKWTLEKLSFLDGRVGVPGQEDSFILNIQERSKTNNKIKRKILNFNGVNMAKNQKRSEGQDVQAEDTKVEDAEVVNDKQPEKDDVEVEDGQETENKETEVEKKEGEQKEEKASENKEIEKDSDDEQDKGMEKDEEDKNEDAKDEEEKSKKEEDSKEEKRSLKRAEWTTAFINDLPDSSFVVIEPAYLDGTTEDKRARHLPVKDQNGNVDLSHLRNAVARREQIKPVTQSITTDELRKQARENLMKIIEDENLEETFPSMFTEQRSWLKKENRRLTNLVRKLQKSPTLSPRETGVVRDGSADEDADETTPLERQRREMIGDEII